MKPKIKIPEKVNFGIFILLPSIVFLLSIIITYNLWKNYPKNNITPHDLLKVICCMMPLPVVLITKYVNLYCYYAPKFRTIEVRSLVDMLALGEGKIYHVLNDHVIGFNLLLKYRELGSSEEYYINLQVPDNEVEFFYFEKKRRELLGDQSLRGISFYKMPPRVEGEVLVHVGYKFWTYNSKAEYELHAYDIGH